MVSQDIPIYIILLNNIGFIFFGWFIAWKYYDRKPTQESPKDYHKGCGEEFMDENELVLTCCQPFLCPECKEGRH